MKSSTDMPPQSSESSFSAPSSSPFAGAKNTAPPSSPSPCSSPPKPSSARLPSRKNSTPPSSSPTSSAECPFSFSSPSSLPPLPPAPLLPPRPLNPPPKSPISAGGESSRFSSSQSKLRWADGFPQTTPDSPADPAFPQCQNALVPPNFTLDGFAAARENPQLNALPQNQLASIHFTHRAFALIALFVIAVFAAKIWKNGNRRAAKFLLAFLALQVFLGISAAVFNLPFWAALGHNAGAALLVAQLASALRSHSHPLAPTPSPTPPPIPRVRPLKPLNP